MTPELKERPSGLTQRRREKRNERRQRESREERVVRRKRYFLVKDISRVLFIVGMFAMAAWLLQSEYVRQHILDIGSLREVLHPGDSIQGQLKSYIIFIVAGTLLIAVGLPRIWISAAAGSIYGAVLGLALAMVTSMLGASVTYLVGRSLLRSMVRRRFEKRIGRWSDRFRKNAFFWVLYLRLFPASNATLTSLLCGCLKVDFRAYTTANAIGFIPLTVIFAMFGSGAAKGNSSQLVIGGVLLLIAVLVQGWYTRSRRIRSARAERGSSS